jgi:hypothetical protein
VLAAAANFNHARLLSFLAVFTAILAAFFSGTITRRMSALVVLLFGHTSRSFIDETETRSSAGFELLMLQLPGAIVAEPGSNCDRQ